MGIVLHFCRPLQKSPEIAPLPPRELPEFQKSDLLHLYAAIGLDAPEQVRTTPRSEMVALGGIPEEPNDIAHGWAVV